MGFKPKLDFDIAMLLLGSLHADYRRHLRRKSGPIPAEIGETNGMMPDTKGDGHLSGPCFSKLDAIDVSGGMKKRLRHSLYTVYSYDYSQREMVVGPAFVPLVGARAEF